MIPIHETGLSTVKNFNADYIRLIDSFRQANPKAKIWICLMTPIFDRHPRFESGTRDWHAQIQKHIRQVATATRVPLIDLNTPLYSRPDLLAELFTQMLRAQRLLQRRSMEP